MEVLSRLDFFRSISPILPDFEDDEFAEICQRLNEDDADLFELPIYGPESELEDDPVAVVVFVDHKVYLDCFEQSMREKLFDILQAMSDLEIGKSRPLTQQDWIIRPQGLQKEEIF